MELPEQIVVSPLMVRGAEGTLSTVTLIDCDADEPQMLFAVTVMLPLVVFEVALMELDVELPVHPLGKVHV